MNQLGNCESDSYLWLFTSISAKFMGTCLLELFCKNCAFWQLFIFSGIHFVAGMHFWRNGSWPQSQQSKVRRKTSGFCYRSAGLVSSMVKACIQGLKWGCLEFHVWSSLESHKWNQTSLGISQEWRGKTKLKIVLQLTFNKDLNNCGDEREMYSVWSCKGPHRRNLEKGAVSLAAEAKTFTSCAIEKWCMWRC